MINGMAGASGAGNMPRSRAVQGVRRPMIIPLAAPSQKTARASRKLIRAPVRKAGRRIPCNARASARKRAVRVRYQELDKVLEKYKGQGGVLIKALQEAQEIYGYLPREILIHVAYELDVPLSEVYSVVSFYSLFKTEPSGKCHLEICSGTACYVKGMKDLLEYLEENLSLKPGGV
jgi:hypothetical protein